MHIIQLVDLDQVLEQHENHVRAQTGLPTVISINELLENLCDYSVEIFIVCEDFLGRELGNFIRYLADGF